MISTNRVLLRSNFSARTRSGGATSSFSRRLLSDQSNNGADESAAVASIWDKPDLQRIFENNRMWRKAMLAKDPEYFKKLSGGQSPTYLLIGCSDSRVGAQEIMGLDQGELFVHRNIANVVVPTDLNFLSVLFYSVNVLKVKEIIVLGHYACGGVRAASQNNDLGLIEHWLRNIRDVQRLHTEELSLITDPEKRHRRLVELNVQEQCFNLYGNSIVQQMQAKTGRPRIHGMVYDIADGKLQYLNIDFKSQIKKYRSIYAVADFRRYQPIDVRDAKKLTQSDAVSEKEENEDSDRLVVIRPNSGQGPPQPLRCTALTTIHELKIAIESLTGLPTERQGLYYEGTKLENDLDTLAAVGISDISEVELREEIVPTSFQRPK